MLREDDYQFLLKNDLTTFIERSFRELNPQDDFQLGEHVEVIADRLLSVLNGNRRRLIINLPPRHLKSHCASIAFVAWALGRDPSLRILCVSYGQELSEKLARDCRQIMLSRWYQRLFPGTQLLREATHDLRTSLGGGRYSTSIGGALTGLGADIILIDDPIKPEDGLSETKRTEVNEWFDNTLLSRLNNKQTGRIILIMQRVHQDDLVGHVLEGGATWDWVAFPAIAIDDEEHPYVSLMKPRVFKRKAGDVLHSARENLETLSAIRQQIGSYNFQSQYQQEPVPKGGNIIQPEWLMTYELPLDPGKFNMIVQSWDTACKTGKHNDFSVCTTWGIRGFDFYLLDVFRMRLNYPDLKRAIVEQAQTFNPIRIIIEDKASGTALLQDLRREILSSKLKPYEAPAGFDKEMRLHAQSAVIERGRLWLPREAPWLAGYVAELIGFPGVRFDDQVDSTTQMLDFLNNHDGLYTWLRHLDPNPSYFYY